MAKGKVKAWYDPAFGALLTNAAVDGLTTELKYAIAIKGYGSKHFVAESMSKRAAKLIAERFDLEWCEKKP